MKLEGFDPPMCCPSGVCGPKVDPALAQAARTSGELAALNVRNPLLAINGRMLPVKEAG